MYITRTLIGRKPCLDQAIQTRFGFDPVPPVPPFPPPPPTREEQF